MTKLKGRHPMMYDMSLFDDGYIELSDEAIEKIRNTDLYGRNKMRQVKYKDVTMMKDRIEITAGDAGPGGASLEYRLMHSGPGGADDMIVLKFQNGDPATLVNGITNEALLSVVLDRLQGFAKGPYPSREISIAITKIEEALHWMFSRSLDREERGVLGKLEK